MTCDYRPPADFTEAEIRREYAIDKQQRAYENRIRQLKQEERQLRACGMDKEAKALRKKWRFLTKDYQIYSLEHNRAHYPYRYVVDRDENTSFNALDEKAIETKEAKAETTNQHIAVSNSLGKASARLMERFDIKSERVIITDKQYETHIAKGANNHDDIYDNVKEHISEIIDEPDYIFISEKKEDSVIYVSEKYKVQLIVKLNTLNPELSNTIITIFGCGKSTLKRLKKKNEILYQKGIDKSENA